jgi:hypothetical protein
MLRTPIPTVPSFETAALIDRADAKRPDGTSSRRVGLSITIQTNAVSFNGMRGAETEVAMHNRNSGSRPRFTKRFGDVGLDRAEDSGCVIRLSECQRQTSARVREKTVVQAVLDGYRGLKGAGM